MKIIPKLTYMWKWKLLITTIVTCFFTVLVINNWSIFPLANLIIIYTLLPLATWITTSFGLIQYESKEAKIRKRKLNEGHAKTNIKPPSKTPKPSIKPAPQKRLKKFYNNNHREVEPGVWVGKKDPRNNKNKNLSPKEYLDKVFGKDRVNGKGILPYLEEYSNIRVKSECSKLIEENKRLNEELNRLKNN